MCGSTEFQDFLADGSAGERWTNTTRAFLRHVRTFFFTALLYASRGRFVEYDVFVTGMPRVLRCREIPQEDLLGGRWKNVTALLAQPAPAERPRLDGAEVAAAEVLKAAL